MIPVHQRAPVDQHLPVQALCEQLQAAEARRPFAPESVALCARVGAMLLDHPASRRWPELVALGYWLRPAALKRLADDFAATRAADPCRFLPRGLALHLPPANVGTLAVYSWALSVLAGNPNAVRLSRRSAGLDTVLVEVFREALAEAPAGLAAANRVLCWDHDDATFAALSSIARVRLIWGGDATVQALRSVPLPPRGVDLCFPDRWSAAVFSADAWRALDEEGRDELARRFFNDAWWFDQQGCSSPRLLAWVGRDTRACNDELVDRAADIARARGWRPDAGAALARLEFAWRAALDAPVTQAGPQRTEACVLRLSSMQGLTRRHCGGGLFFHVELTSLLDLLPHLGPRDQTLCWFGFQPRQLRELADALGDRGVDRIVPVGHALRFSRYWDGVDLLQSLTRRVHVMEHR